MRDSISSIILPRKFCLDSRIYNISSEIVDKHIRKKKKNGNRIL